MVLFWHLFSMLSAAGAGTCASSLASRKKSTSASKKTMRFGPPSAASKKRAVSAGFHKCSLLYVYIRFGSVRLRYVSARFDHAIPDVFHGGIGGKMTVCAPAPRSRLPTTLSVRSSTRTSGGKRGLVVSCSAQTACRHMRATLRSVSIRWSCPQPAWLVDEVGKMHMVA